MVYSRSQATNKQERHNRMIRSPTFSSGCLLHLHIHQLNYPTQYSAFQSTSSSEIFATTYRRELIINLRIYRTVQVLIVCCHALPQWWLIICLRWAGNCNLLLVKSEKHHAYELRVWFTAHLCSFLRWNKNMYGMSQRRVEQYCKHQRGHKEIRHIFFLFQTIYSFDFSIYIYIYNLYYKCRVCLCV
jgi:hypothetical protein